MAETPDDGTQPRRYLCPDCEGWKQTGPQEPPCVLCDATGSLDIEEAVEWLMSRLVAGYDRIDERKPWQTLN